MSMEINGTFNQYRADYAGQLKESLSPDQTEKAAGSEKSRETDKTSGQIPALQDEYISSEKSGASPVGLYRVGQDENGNRKIFFDDPKKAAASPKKEPVKPKTDAAEEAEEKCTMSTDKVDREIRKLKEKKQQLERQIKAAAGDDEKLRELEKKLSQVEGELSQKDNDTYRKQHSTVV